MADVNVPASLHTKYGAAWFLGRTYDPEGQPHWWRAKRRRILTAEEMSRGLSMTVICDTKGVFIDALDQQAELEQRLAAESAAPAWNPAYLCPPPPGHQIPGSDPAQGVDHKAAVAALRLRFPRVMVWYGSHTGMYWAMVDNRLVKAETAEQLGRQLEASFLPPRRP